MQLIPVDLGKDKILIPIERIGSESKTFQVVITAGLDGDEYAGIQAAYTLIKNLREEKYPFQITVIPVVNLVGFLTHQSKNPLDGKYLKHIFPGSGRGSSSDRIMYWLFQNILSSAQIWIDLHSGTLSEELTPFIYGCETNNPLVNQITKCVIQSSRAEKALFTTNRNSFVEAIAKQGISYIRLESGQKGEMDKKWINQHIQWIRRMLSYISQRSELNASDSNVYPLKLFRKSIEYRMIKSGLWYPVNQVGKPIVQNQLLGSVYSLDQKLVGTIISKMNGILLWQNAGMYIEKNDSVLEIASDLQ